MPLQITCNGICVSVSLCKLKALSIQCLMANGIFRNTAKGFFCSATILVAISISLNAKPARR
jgi:hypothetical protein